MKRAGTLQPPDTHHLSSAIGWIELGDLVEATLDLGRISPASRVHPDVLEAHWQIHAKTMEWDKCAAVARQTTLAAPENAFGWIHLSFALHELKSTQAAYDNLAGVLDEFPEEWLMRYNLACYSCQLGNLDEAKQWLTEARRKGGAKQIKSMASDDPDLAPLFQAEK